KKKKKNNFFNNPSPSTFIILMDVLDSRFFHNASLKNYDINLQRAIHGAIVPLNCLFFLVYSLINSALISTVNDKKTGFATSIVYKSTLMQTCEWIKKHTRLLSAGFILLFIVPGCHVHDTSCLESDGSCILLTAYLMYSVDCESNYGRVIESHPNLISYWRFSDEGASIKDNRGINAGVTSTGGSFRTEGICGGSGVVFDGSTRYISISDAASGDTLDFVSGQDFAIELWFNPGTQSANNVIISKWTGGGPYPYTVRYNSLNQLIFARNDSSAVNPAVSTVLAPDGIWHHAVGQRRNGSLELYLDAILKSQVTDNTTPTTENSTDVYFGSQSSATNFYNGSVDEIAFYRTGLDPATIQSHNRIAKY
ncbi:MAG: LamG domain-containing protein, partial [Leptospiraceae bacterium]|nr:LamG domain-containing protein [Leptospiraceae bacterium]